MAANVFRIIDDHPSFSQALVTLLGDAFPCSRFLTAGTLDQGQRLLLSTGPANRVARYQPARQQGHPCALTN